MIKKEGAANAPIPKSALSSPSNASVFIQSKDSDFQGDRQYHPCTYCANWTRCLGYAQWKECACRILRKEVKDE